MHKGELEVITYDSSNSRTVRKTDSVVDSILDKFIDRSQVGKSKYGTDLDRQDLGLHDWCEHAIEEAMDLILYLRKVQKTLDPKK
jgi:hypothetical protein